MLRGSKNSGRGGVLQDPGAHGRHTTPPAGGGRQHPQVARQADAEDGRRPGGGLRDHRGAQGRGRRAARVHS
eukprot:scaffold60304_cov22-Prasinocladus_malaysianus.AAC.1